jgi:hypothetical protein
MLDESARYAVQQQAFEAAVNSGVFS